MDAVTCGIDWAEGHHDISLVDSSGVLVARTRVTDDPAGVAQLIGMLTVAGDRPGQLIPVAIETPHGLLVATLQAQGRPVYAINPLAVARYRDRISVAGRKSDHGAALVLANILRTNRHLHRPLSDDRLDFVRHSTSPDAKLYDRHAVTLQGPADGRVVARAWDANWARN